MSVVHTHTHTAPGNTLKGKQMDELIQTHTQTQCCSCKKTANVKMAEMNHANGSADSCVQYYDFKPFKD